MSKDISAADVAAFFAAQGLAVPAEIQEKIDNEIPDAAFHTLNDSFVKVDGEKTPARVERITGIVDSVFSLTAAMEEGLTPEVRNRQGRGSSQVARRTINLTTPTGTVKIQFDQDVPSAK